MSTTCTRQLQPRDKFESWHPRVCGRPLIEDGTTLCKVHEGVERRRRVADAERQAERQADERRRSESERRVEQLERYLTKGAASAHWRATSSRYTGGVILSAAAVDQLLQLLERTP